MPITGIATLSSKLPVAPAQAIVASLPITRAPTMMTASGMTGLTLPGMIDEPGCRSGMCSSPRPVFGPDPIQRRSLQILVSETAMTRRAPDASTSPSRAPCASKWSFASVIGSPESAASDGDDLLREARRGVDAGADGGAAERNLGDAGERRPAIALDAEPHLARVAAELLAEGDRGRVHEVGAAGLHGALPQLGLLLERDGEVVERGDEVADEGARDGDVHRGREHVVRRLRRVDVVVGVHGRAELARSRGSRAPRSCSCSSEVPEPVW